MSRTKARKQVFYLLFQMSFAPAEEFEGIKDLFYLENEEELQKVDKDFIDAEVNGTILHLEEIDTIIGTVAKGWTTERMARIDLAILRLAAYEIKFSRDTPKSVAINEAVELAKKFSSEEAPAFINGILAKL